LGSLSVPPPCPRVAGPSTTGAASLPGRSNAALIQPARAVAPADVDAGEAEVVQEPRHALVRSQPGAGRHAIPSTHRRSYQHGPAPRTAARVGSPARPWPSLGVVGVIGPGALRSAVPGGRRSEWRRGSTKSDGPWADRAALTPVVPRLRGRATADVMTW